MPKRGPSSLEERLRRIEGQVRGVEKMINEKKEISQVLVQIQAITSSLESVKIELIKKDIKEKIISNIDKSIEMIKK